MAMTFRFGPNHWCEESVARDKGYKRYDPANPKRAAAPLRPNTASPRPKMPPPPEQSRTPIVYMRKNEMAAERERLEAWMVKVAALEMNRAETAIYDQVKYRADELYAFERMSR